MALIKCKDCSNDVSDTAKTCPYCGAKFSKPNGCAKLFVISFGSLFLLIGFGSYMNQSKNTQSPELSNLHSGISKTPNNIVAECFPKAGIKADDSTHKVTIDEINNVVECASQNTKR